MSIDIAFPRYGAPGNTAAVRASIAGASELPDDARVNRRAQRSVFFDERARSGLTRSSGAAAGTYQSGLFGEEVVADGLRTAGWRILGNRVKTRVGEIDVIARRGSTVVFAEVKTCSPGRLDVTASIGSRSRSRIRRAAVAWMQANQSLQVGVRHYRFDVFIVQRDRDGGITRIDHVRDAF